ncbi:MAG: ribonuclease III [Lachnospiraceae bacterium]|nr:ribonuclease III [Lachnospiraceae bacterium]
MNSLLILEKKIGYEFKNQKLLLDALTHSSYANEKDFPPHSDNERLEFLGDAVLELLSSDFLYRNYREQGEGELSKLRASLVCEMALSDIANRISLGKYIRLSVGEEKTGGRERKSILSDALEAVIGAIFLDGGIEPAKTFVEGVVLTDIENRRLFYDAKTILQERVQAEGAKLHYEEIGESGPEHKKVFVMKVMIGERVIGQGEGPSKKAAEQEAAYKGLLLLAEEKKDVS